MCACGLDRKKPTYNMTNTQCIDQIALKCDKQHVHVPLVARIRVKGGDGAVSYTHLRAHETGAYL
eukprot:1671793-Pyramimonas_sp.AAC.1